jgi:pyruvate formate lyase activating enzyme
MPNIADSTLPGREPDPSRPWSYLRGIQPVSLCDWPGRVSCVLFLGGCNLRCPTCHNRALAWEPESLPPLSPERATAQIVASSRWLDGIVVSGGEPTSVPGIAGILQELGRLGPDIKLDTNGMRPGVLRELLESDLVQAVAVDLKGPWRKYPELTGNGCSSEQARGRFATVFRLAERFPGRFSFRCTAVPGLTEEDFREAQDCLPEGFRLQQQTYQPVEPVR